jgi:hypothetical protein
VGTHAACTWRERVVIGRKEIVTCLDDAIPDEVNAENRVSANCAGQTHIAGRVLKSPNVS